MQNVWSKRWTRAEESGKIEKRKRTNSVALRKAETNLPDIEIGRSAGAKAHNENILGLQTGEIFHFAEGTRIQNIQVFAGKGTKHPLRQKVAEGLSRQFGGSPLNRQHCKGQGIIAYNDEERPAEVHWFQEETVGRVRFKIKDWLDES